MTKANIKSQELIQAQIATFAAERVEYYQDSGYIFNNLGSLALGKVGDITRVTTSDEYHKNGDSYNSLLVPEGTERTVAKIEEYSDFLRSVGGSRYEAIQGRAEILKEYSRFESSIAYLRNELAKLATRKEHPNFLGAGSNATVFSINEGDKSYAVRVPNGMGVSPASIDSHLAGAVLGKGIPHLEQIVAASYKDGVTIAEVMPGKEVGQLTPDEIKGVTDEQLSELVDTLVAINEQGIEIDPKPSNFLYDPEVGFGIVDYHSSKEAGKNSKDQELAEIVGWMATPIDNAGFYGKPYKHNKTTEDYAHNLEFTKASLGVLERYRKVVEAKLKDEEQKTALVEIDKRIASSQRSVGEYSSPQWVAERIALQYERDRQRKERANKPAIDDWISI